MGGWAELRGEFEEADYLIDIYADEMSSEDWETAFQFVTEAYPCSFTWDSEDAPLPRSFAEVSERARHQAPRLVIEVDGVHIHWNFFIEGDPQLEMDAHPREIGSESAFQALMGFLERLAGVLRRPVRITPESLPESPIAEVAPPQQGQ